MHSLVIKVIVKVKLVEEKENFSEKNTYKY